MMFHHVAAMLLVVALTSAGGSASFAHIHPHGHDHDAPLPEEAQAHNQSAHHRGQGAHWHLNGRHAADSPGTDTLAGDRHHHASVSFATVAVERSTVLVGATSALVEMREAGLVPAPPARPIPVAANTRLNPPPRVILAARAPPV